MNRILIVLAVVISSCKIVQLPESTVANLPKVEYIKVCSTPLIVGGKPFETIKGTVVFTGKSKFSLVDSKNERVSFLNEVDLMNYFAEYGWLYVDYSVLKMKTTPNLHFYLLQKKK